MNKPSKIPSITAELVIDSFAKGQRAQAFWKVFCPYCQRQHFYSAGSVLSVSTIVKYNSGQHKARCCSKEYYIKPNRQQVEECLWIWKKINNKKE